MNALDWILVAVGAVSILRGLTRGMVSQVCGLAGLVGGFLLAAHMYAGVAARLKDTFSGLPYPEAVAFISLYVLAGFGAALIGWWLGSILHRTGFGWTDRVLGAGVGGLKGILFSVVLVYLLAVFLPGGSPFLAQSLLAPRAREAGDMLLRWAPEGMKRSVMEQIEALRKSLSEAETIPAAPPPPPPPEKQKNRKQP